MYDFIAAVKRRMAPDAQELLKEIYAPVVVAEALSDSRRDLCILPDGEIRCYGFVHLDPRSHAEDKPHPAYISSVDGGISWTKHLYEGGMGPCLYIPETGKYISTYFNLKEYGEGRSDGCYVCVSDIGPDDPEPRLIKVANRVYRCLYQPVRSVFSDRIFFTGEIPDFPGEDCTPGFFYSDDFGETWKEIYLPMPPRHEVEYPHKAPRWSIGSGVEPVCAEVAPNHLMVLLRNSTDYFYMTESFDNGETWSEPAPSHFRGTDTTAFLLRLHDGRMVSFWNNTQPMPEERHEAQNPPQKADIIRGRWEDVFTNRDIAHAAVSEDGEHWIGYREILLNGVRNNSDFRYYNNRFTAGDKSVHQFQAFELPYGKILVSAGQNEASRRLVIFDVRWLYENSLSENFGDGLSRMTTHVYVKSVTGPRTAGVNGHCAWNRTNGALLMPDPEGSPRERLYISTVKDPRLVNDTQGVSWNFPASATGCVKIRLRLDSGVVRVSLSDRWFNCCDPTTDIVAPLSFELDPRDLVPGFTTLTIRYDTAAGRAWVSDETRSLFSVRLRGECLASGISYLILQNASFDTAVWVASMEKTVE